MKKRKCSGTTCTTASSGTNDAAPFCGNSVSAANTGNIVAIGECGKCQKATSGISGASTCSDNDSVTDATNCVQGTCDSGKVCCKDGKCATAGSGATTGENCT